MLQAVSRFFMIVFIAGVFAGSPSMADDHEAEMDVKRLGSIIESLDEGAKRADSGAMWRFQLDGVEVIVIADGKAKRMRALVGIAKAEELPAEALMRLMQANFDTALDARYAVANGVLWSVYIHPLDRLSDDQLLSGLAQVVTLAKTFGTTFTSGSLTYGGGDSRGLLEEDLRNRLIEKGFSL